MKKIELPIQMMDYNDKEIKDFLEKNNIKNKILGESSLGGGNYTKVIDDGDYGWDGDYEEEWIKDC